MYIKKKKLRMVVTKGFIDDVFTRNKIKRQLPQQIKLNVVSREREGTAGDY